MDITGSNPAFVADQVRQQTAQTATQASSNTLNANFDTFLTLLTAQLKNQDPLNPLKSNEFTQQLVQYSSVEQSIATNRNLDALIALNAAEAGNHAVSYIGKQVTAVGSTAELKNGEATWEYVIAKDAQTVSVSVVNVQGATVFTQLVDGKAGAKIFSWDGKSKTGVDLPEGSYALSISASDIKGQPVVTSVSTSGTVSEVDFTGGSPILKLKNRSIPLANVVTVK